jgi:hypothetical protein
MVFKGSQYPAEDDSFMAERDRIRIRIRISIRVRIINAKRSIFTIHGEK